MKVSLLVRLLTAAAVMASSLLALPAALGSINVDSVELLERTRVGRTTFDYTYRITVTNTAPVALDEVVAYLTQNASDPTHSAGAPGTIVSELVFDGTGVREPNAGSGTILLDDIVAIGTMAAGETIVSTDTFTLRQDRQFQLATESLIWEVGFTSVATLSGLVTDQVIPFAEVEVTLDRSESGRPIIESGRPIIERYTTTADDGGNYSVDVDFVTGSDFVSISADGVNNLDFVALNSIAGSAKSLYENATETQQNQAGRPQINGADANELNVTHVSTALAALATEANGGTGFTNDEDLAIAQAQVDNDNLLIAAAVLKTVIDNVNIDLPPGVATTEDLLADPDAFNSFLETLEEDFPVELEAAIEETITDISVGYVAAELPEQLYLSLVRENPLRSDAGFLTFDQNGTGTHIGANGETTDADWIVNAEGEIILTLNNPPAAEFFEFLEVPPGSGMFEQVRVLESQTALRVVRIAVGVQSDQVLVGSTVFRTFPDHAGVFPDEIVVTDPGPDNGRLAFETSGLLPYTNAELAGAEIEMTYFHSANNGVGLVTENAGADLLTFNANGTGTTARRQFTFDWSVDAEGRLVILFANGDRNEYARYAQLDQGIVDVGVIIARHDAGLVNAYDSLAVRAGTIDFDTATLVDHKLRSGAFITDPNALFAGGVTRFDFNFTSADMGCRDSGTLRFFDWDITESDHMQLNWDIGSFFRQRDWQAVAVVPGQLGTRYWVIENLESSDDPGLLTDPNITPGRVNFYEDIKDISGNTPPTAVDDSAATIAGTPIFIDVLANDTDAENDTILLWSFTGSTLGGIVELSVDPTGVFYDGFNYTPPVGVTDGTDTFTYDLADGSCALPLASAGTVTITIGAGRLPPADAKELPFQSDNDVSGSR